jgi:hypothetical protein
MSFLNKHILLSIIKCTVMLYHLSVKAGSFYTDVDIVRVMMFFYMQNVLTG